MCSKSRRGQRKNLISRRAIDLPNVETKKIRLKKLNTVSEISETLIIELTFASLKVQIEKEAGEMKY